MLVLHRHDAEVDLPETIKALLDGLPTAAILEGDHGELEVLLPATAKPLIGKASCGLVLNFDRGDDQWIGAGGAITVLSDPVKEWEEIELKARAILRAFASVERERSE